MCAVNDAAADGPATAIDATAIDAMAIDAMAIDAMAIDAMATIGSPVARRTRSVFQSTAVSWYVWTAQLREACLRLGPILIDELTH